MLRFFPGEIPKKGFYSPDKGYNNWYFLNNEYQVQSIHHFRGWHRALVDFAGGMSCHESSRRIGERYQALPSVNLVYLDLPNDCKYVLFCYLFFMCYMLFVVIGFFVRVMICDQLV